MFPSFAAQTLERLPATATTDHGNTVWTYPETGDMLTGCVVDPVQSREDNINRTATITQYSVQVPPKYTVDDNDHFRYRGKVYQIIGEVQFQPSPTGMLDQLVFTMERWSG
jgi:hypothetical protein